MRRLLFLLLAIIGRLHAQSTPETFRLVTPKGPGSITINTAGGWAIERFVLYDSGTRAVILLQNKSLGLDVSYILSNDETFDYNKESCKNDVLGPVVRDVLKKATLKNKQNAARPLPTGQTLDMGSYLIVKNEGIDFNQENVFGFIAQEHTCAEIHLSRTPFKEGEEHLFEAALDGFAFDPAYAPTSADYGLMASLLPPAMASAYLPKPDQTTPASKPGDTNQVLSFALPNHPGLLQINSQDFTITELSAKTNGNEFGIRAEERVTGLKSLGFLYLPQQKAPITAAACMQKQLESELRSIQDQAILRNFVGKRLVNNSSGLEIAIAEYSPTKKKPNPFGYTERIFLAANDLCADISFDSDKPITPALLDPILNATTFDPNRPADFFAKFRYATVLYDHRAYAAAAPIYESALALVDNVPDAQRWRRVTTDQASMSYGIAGDLKRSRAINEAAILKDPDYPLYYYNLACADAESGDATAARTHLGLAYARRANTLKGEAMPDASKDDSILKLKANKDFWAFVQSLSRS